VQVLWWLVPPLVATFVAMGWASWAGRSREEVARDDSEEALERMRQALARPTPTAGTPVTSTVLERTHGVAVRGAARRPAPVIGSSVPDGHR
jgi:hypothetical protein